MRSWPGEVSACGQRVRGRSSEVFDDIRLWLKFRRVRDVIRREGGVYDVRITLLKGLKAMAFSLLAVVLTAVTAYLADPVAVTKSLEGSLSPVLIAVIVPLVTALAHAGQNYLKNKD